MSGSQLAAFNARGLMHEDWETPPEIFDPLHKEFRFTVDAAASADNSKLPNGAYWSRFTAGGSLNFAWGNHRVWLNPPYGHKNLARWVQKAYEESRKGTFVVCLVPSYTGQRWWIDYAQHADEIRWIPGKVKFIGARSCARFYCAILIFAPSPRGDGRTPEPPSRSGGET